MTRHRAATLAAVLAFVVGLGVSGPAARLDAAPQAPAKSLPERLTDDEFWKLSQELSEPGGYFRSDNLLSNELWFQDTLNDLIKRTKPGGVYLGVGPEQNFTYIAALKPKMVFITDIRRGNLHTQLMYKALFEMSADRAEFVSRLFTKPRPAGLSAKSTAAEIMNAYWDVFASPDPVFKANLQAIFDHLTKKPHTLPLSKEDLDGIEYVYYNFYWFGPSITYNSTAANGGGGRGNMANYHSLMVSTDSAGGLNRTFLASEENFKVLKDLAERNLLVPVVGNFGGPKALRAVGQYIRERGASVTAFYLSNVEQYLYMDGIWTNFCANVASMPLDEQSTFIRSSQGGGGGGGGGLVNSLGSMRTETLGCVGRSPGPSSPAR